MISYIYEVELSNGRKIITRQIKEIVDFINNNFNDNDFFKNATASMIRNYINLNQLPKYITKLDRHNYMNYFEDTFNERYGNKNYSARSRARLVNNIYNEFMLNQQEQKNKNIEKNMNNQQNYENMCEAEDDMNMWNGE